MFEILLPTRSSFRLKILPIKLFTVRLFVDKLFNFNKLVAFA